MYDPVGQVPHTTLHSTSGDPIVPRGAVVLLMIWCAIEGTFFAFALRPTMAQLVSDLSGFTINPTILVVLLAIFLTVIVAGAFAGIQVLNDAIKARQIANIMSMIVTEAAVAGFQVYFLHRVMVDNLTPWLAQSGVAFGAGGMIALACLVWFSVRGMTWYLLGRAGAPALAAVLNRLDTRHR